MIYRRPLCLARSVCRLSLEYLAVTCAIQVFCASEVRAATITVETTVDEVSVNGKCSLREAIDSANGDQSVDSCVAGSGLDTILIPAGTYVVAIAGAQENENATGDFDILSDVQLVGSGSHLTVINGAGLDRVFDARCEPKPGNANPPRCKKKTNIVISKLRITNGNSLVGPGGAVRVARGTGPQNRNPVLTIDRSTIISNTANLGGGVANEGELTIRRSVLNANSALLGGAGLYNEGTALVEDSSIVYNSTSSSGAGMKNIGSVVIRRSNISSNTAVGSGGGFLDINGVSHLENCTLARNSGANGGGIACSDGTGGCDVSVNHLTVRGNIGGGIRVNSDAVEFTSVMRITNSIVSNSTGPDVDGSFMSNGYNLIQSVGSAVGFSSLDVTGVDPLLDYTPLYRGGHSPSLSFKLNSPVHNAGTCEDNDGVQVVEDQRSEPRPTGANCDIGSYEAVTPTGAYQIVTVESPLTNYHTKNVVADCPPGSKPLSAGWIALDPSGVPLDAQVYLSEPSWDSRNWIVAVVRPGSSEDWRLHVRVVCGRGGDDNPLASHQLIIGESQLDTVPQKQFSHSCPSGSKALGTGWTVLNVNSNILSGRIRYALPNSTGEQWTANASYPYTAPAWKLRLRSICLDLSGAAAAVNYEVIEEVSSLDDSPNKNVQVSCPAGKSAAAFGWGAFDSNDTIVEGQLSATQPMLDGSGWSLDASYSEGGSSDWKLLVSVVCIDPAGL